MEDQSGVMVTDKLVEETLHQVMDPEIPVLSVMDLGMITGISIGPDSIEIKMIPTFSACPAIHIIRKQIQDAVSSRFLLPVEVIVDKDISWNSNRISEAGKEKLRSFKIAAPARIEGAWDEKMLSEVPCPFCGSDQTYLRSPFGSTLCRALHYCKNCGSLFEHFKPLE
jgi:ring-1,2-phenylacetyl-CoA epoxidase subunit PaaD